MGWLSALIKGQALYLQNYKQKYIIKVYYRVWSKIIQYISWHDAIYDNPSLSVQIELYRYERYVVLIRRCHMPYITWTNSIIAWNISCVAAKSVVGHLSDVLFHTNPYPIQIMIHEKKINRTVFYWIGFSYNFWDILY